MTGVRVAGKNLVRIATCLVLIEQKARRALSIDVPQKRPPGRSCCSAVGEVDGDGGFPDAPLQTVDRDC